MILKRNFNPVKVFHYVRWEMAFSAIAAITAYLLYRFGFTGIVLPFSVAAILGSALAIFIAFRNNTSYGRWWEARTHWSGIATSCRVLARLVITFSDSHSHQENYRRDRSDRFKNEMVLLIIAWANTLRRSLREQDDWNEIKPFLSEADFSELLSKQNKSNYLQLLIGKRIYEAMANGTLGGFDSFQLEGQLLALSNFQGGCERIKKTPLLRQYDFFTRVFLLVFLLLLPFSLIGDLSRTGVDMLVIPVSMIISFVFAVIGKVGEVNEDPFENRITDVPMTAICETIERDLKEMLGQETSAASIEATGGYLY